MAELDIKSLTANIKCGGITGFYFFYGDDDYMKKRCTSALVKKACDMQNAQVREFERHNFDLGALEDESEMVPFGAACRLFILRDIEADKMDSDSLDRLVKVLENPAPWCVFVWVLYTSKFDPKNAKWKKVKKVAEKSGRFTDFAKTDRSTAEKRLCEMAKKQGCLMTRDTAGYLISLAGEDFGVLAGELEKICAYSAGAQITNQTVDMLVSKSTEASVYDLSKAILNRNSTKAFSLIDSYYYMKIDPIIILSGVTGVFVDLYRAKATKLSGGDPSQLIKDFDYPKNIEFRAKNAFRDCASYSLSVLRRCVVKLTEADMLLKGSRADSRIVLETLVCELVLLLDEENRGAGR
ncbi:MAG: DNA polymerase III subunit delta [Clostridia bacterium]|nr:DNA polymerase III subunit delta [Clostridia bacterium]